MIKNILILGALAGAGIFIYNKWIKKEVDESTVGIDGTTLKATYKRRLVNPYTNKPYNF